MYSNEVFGKIVDYPSLRLAHSKYEPMNTDVTHIHAIGTNRILSTMNFSSVDFSINIRFGTGGQ